MEEDDTIILKTIILKRIILKRMMLAIHAH